MRARWFGLILLVLVGVLPLAVFGWVAEHRSRATAVTEVRDGNRRLARSVASRIAAFGENQRALLTSVGAAALDPTVADPQAVIESFTIGARDFHDLTIYHRDGRRWVAEPSRTHGVTFPEIESAAATALDGRSYRGGVSTTGGTTGGLAHTVTLGEPVVIAGERVGAVVARLDMVDMWEPINAVRIGRNGFVRLLSLDGVLLAHGDPEERRFVWVRDPARADRDAHIVASALLGGETVRNQRGLEVVASAATVPGRDWLVVVEEPAADAYAPAAAMRRDLLLLAGGTLLLAVLCGLALGRTVVTQLESLRTHTAKLASGDLDARIEPKHALVEVRALASSLNEMAASLKRLHDEARGRERLSTFARVAAGLAHDLRQPIEVMRTAAGDILADPDDEAARDMFRWVAENELPKLKRYVEDLQRLAREGKIDLELSSVSPRELAETVVGDLVARRKWPGVEFTVSGEAPDIIVDANLVRRALYNLSSNGADACGRTGFVHIEVADSDDNATLALRVRDTGSGMSAEHVAQLQSGDFTSTKRTTGVGLGFGVARHVATSHGGRIDVQSEIGKGTCMTLLLPRRADVIDEGEDDGERRVGGTSLEKH